MHVQERRDGDWRELQFNEKEMSSLISISLRSNILQDIRESPGEEAA